ncbi:Thioesterase/thiol ester dehydrase-isomerase [Xylariaceae sp. FL1272]|nr:Thioesterase/thiol ester dehydrase-isomerase [Xylariaceae sp. FL1272]
MSRAAIESQIAVKEASKDGADVLINEESFTTQPSGRAVFGGLLLSQAIMAASTTVSTDLHPYSSHSSFLRPVTVSADDHVRYDVERVASGRSSATRLVRGFQGTSDVCVYVATISFQRPQPSKPHNDEVLTYCVPMPQLDGLRPDDIGKDLNQQLLAGLAGRNKLWQFMSPDEDPFDWRPFGFVQAENAWECFVRAFARSPPLSTRSPTIHLAALAYMSDEILFGISIFANPEQVGSQSENVTMGATLNHTMTFHDPSVKVDEWVVVERQTSCGSEGRTLIHERIWNLESGRLVMSCTQEAVIRLKPSESKL